MTSRARRFGLGMVLAIVPLGLTAHHRRPGASQEPLYRISALHAMLFYTDSGTFSPDILSDRRLINLWNTPGNHRLDHEIGGPSNATLVIVEIRGQGESYVAGRRVDFRATSGKKVLLHRTSDIYVGAPGKAYVAFWLYNTGCEPIQLSARLVGQSDQSLHSARIPFRCGE